MNCHRSICGTVSRVLTRTCSLSLLVLLSFAARGRAAEATSPAKPAPEEPAKAAVAAESAKPAADKALTLDKVEVVTNLLAGTGETLLQREEIVRRQCVAHDTKSTPSRHSGPVPGRRTHGRGEQDCK